MACVMRNCVCRLLQTRNEHVRSNFLFTPIPDVKQQHLRGRPTYISEPTPASASTLVVRPKLAPALPTNIETVKAADVPFPLACEPRSTLHFSVTPTTEGRLLPTASAPKTPCRAPFLTSKVRLTHELTWQASRHLQHGSCGFACVCVFCLLLRCCESSKQASKQEPSSDEDNSSFQGGEFYLPFTH